MRQEERQYGITERENIPAHVCRGVSRPAMPYPPYFSRICLFNIIRAFNTRKKLPDRKINTKQIQIFHNINH